MRLRTAIVLGVFCLLSLILLLHHEPWRDEAQAWLIARDSPTLGSMFHWAGYEGTPMLWNLILFPLAHAGLPYWSMSLVHFLIALAAAFLFVRYAPFPFVYKFLAVLGYYFLYEYNTIARNYALSVLLLFAIATVYRDRFRRPVLYALLVVLLANTNVHSLVIALVLSGAYAYEYLIERKERFTPWHTAAFLLVALGGLAAAYQVLPPPDLQPATAGWHLDLSPRNIGGIPHAVLGAFFPVPKLQITFWNSQLAYSLTRGMALLGVPLFLFSLLFFVRKPVPGLIYLFSCGGLFCIFFFKHRGDLRQHGLIYILFLFCLWIACEYGESLWLKRPGFLRRVSRPMLDRGLLLLFLFQVAASPIAFYYELGYPFSGSKQAAAFLKTHGFAAGNVFIAAYPSYAAEPILPYLPEPHGRFYYPEFSGLGSFIVWNTTYAKNQHLPLSEVLSRVGRAARKKDARTVLLILNRPVENRPGFARAYHLLASFDHTIVPDESLYIYQAGPSPGGAR